MIDRKRVPKPLSAYGWRPPKAEGQTVYCSDCKPSHSAPAGPGSQRCRQAAILRKANEDGLLMPEPLPFAGTHHYTIQHLFPDQRRLEYARPTDQERRLGWFVLPPFQRPPVWTLEQQTKLIESLWLNLPIGYYVLNTPETYQHPTDLWLIDGQQRISAILDYVAGYFPVFGHRYTDLTIVEQRTFENIVFPCISLRLENEAELEDLYNRLAYGGTHHELKEPADD